MSEKYFKYVSSFLPPFDLIVGFPCEIFSPKQFFAFMTYYSFNDMRSFYFKL